MSVIFHDDETMAGGGGGGGGGVPGLELELELEPLTEGRNGSGGSHDPPAHHYANGRGRIPRGGGSSGVIRAASFGSGGGGGGGGGGGSRGRKPLVAAAFLLFGLATLVILRGEEEAVGEGLPAGRPKAPAAPAAAEPPTPAPTTNAATDAPTGSPTGAPTAAPGPMTSEERYAAMVERWGQWHFWDGEEESRPGEDYAAAYPNRDVPAEAFPEASWQVDAVYVNHFLNDAADLLSRAHEAIYAEYGHGKPLPPAQMIDRAKMTRVHKVNLSAEGAGGLPPPDYRDGGGWTTARSQEGMQRRFLHAIMSNDSFEVVVLGEGPAASGIGNHFGQTFGMQFQRIMEPIFDRLNVRFEVRHMVREKGGLMDAMGLADLVGRDIDLLIWDSAGSGGDNGGGMSDAGLDLLFRQSALAGNRIPFILNAGDGGSTEILKFLHENAGMDVGGLGMGWHGIPVTESDEQASALAWPVRYLRCAEGKDDLCERAKNKYLNTCWIEREDFDPPTKQEANIPGAGGEHPGWRYHQLKGRMLAFMLLTDMSKALNEWSDIMITSGYPLPDDYWHVTGYYEDIREKITSLDFSAGACGKIKDYLPERVCKIALKGRSEFTPRLNPQESGISTVVKAAEGGYVPNVEETMLYEAPDRPIPLLALPDDVLDVRKIVSAGLRRLGEGKDEGVVPGLGWEIKGELPGNCDGTSTGICGRQSASACLLAGNMDSYGGLLGNEYSGWLVMTAQDVTEGVIVLGIDFITYSPDDNERTRGWTEAKTSMKKGKKVKLDEDKTKGDEEGKEGKNDKDGDGGRNLRSQLGFDEDTVGIRRLLPETFR